MRSVFALILSWLKKVFHIGDKPNDPETDPTDPPIPEIDRPERPDPNDIVCYYGCPNSKKAQKLQLSRRSYR